MNILFLIEYAVALFFLWLMIFIIYKNPKALPNRISALFFSCFVIWNFFGAFYTIAETKKSAEFLSNILSIGWSFFPVFALWLALATKNKKRILNKWYFYFFVFAIPLFFIYLQFTGRLVNDNIRVYYGWLGVLSNSVWSYLYIVYTISFLVISLLLSYFSISKARYYYEKKREIIIIFTGIIPIILGAITNILFPILKIGILPQLGSILPVIWAGGIVYAITKYGLLTITPSYAAADILETMTDYLIILDVEGRIREINKSALDLLGYTRAEVIGAPGEILFHKNGSRLNGDDPGKSLSGYSFRNRRDCIMTKKGDGIPVNASSSAMRDKDGFLIGIVYTARDMRETIELHEKERMFAIEKARTETLQERAQELQEAYDRLKAAQSQMIISEKMAALGQLAGGVAHEINNPMGVILGFAQSVVTRISGDDPLYNPLKSIEREAVRCRKMIADLLAFSRTGKSQDELIDINQAIDGTLSLIESQTRLMDIRITREFGLELPFITANKNQIQQVIVNVCNNAIDDIPEGGCINISTKRSGMHIVVEISYNGNGMNEEIKKHICEPFISADNAGKGRGPGLNLSCEIIRNHNGAIEVESEAGKGSLFRIKLPLNRNEEKRGI